MLTKRQNMIETMKGGHPDRFVNGYEALGLVMGSPFGKRNPNPKPGELNVVNAWGVTKSWPKGTPGAFPVHTPDKIVIKDIDEWQKYLKIPRVVYDAEEWEPFIEMYEKVDRNEQFACTYFAPGVFEQCHYLLEIQNCLMAFYESPDEMHELIDAITQFELDYAAEVCKYLKPEGLFHHDDWGSQISTFLSPDMFREFIKPAYMKIYHYYKDMITLRKKEAYASVLETGWFVPVETRDDRLFCYRRKNDSQSVRVLINFSADYVRVPENLMTGEVLLSNREASENGRLMPYHAIVFSE